MDLADILPEESVIFCTDVSTKREALEILADRAAARTAHSADAIFEALDGREALGSTELGNGIAIPHGKLPGLDGVTAVFVRLAKPIEFDAVDDQPVDILFALLAPLGSGADHLRALALVARLLRTESVVDELRSTKDPARLHQVLIQPLTTHKAA